MLDLGSEVLKKIENLLTQIDHTSRHKRKTPNGTTKVIKQQHPTIQGKENTCNQRIQKLYKDHLTKKLKDFQMNKQKAVAEMFQNRPFKVQNKHSIFLNQQKKKRKPIYERTRQIMLQREKSIKKIRQNLPRRSKQEDQELQMEEILRNHSNSFRKYTKEELAQKMIQMEKRNMKRLQKLNQQKLQHLFQNQKKYSQKPSISKESVKIWKQKQLKKNLSSNLLQRFEQYDFQRKKNWDQYLKTRRNQQTPFSPKLTQTTRYIAERSRSKTSVFQNISRSLSCKCLNRSSQAANPSTLSKEINGGSTGINTSRSRQLLSSRKKYRF